MEKKKKQHDGGDIDLVGEGFYFGPLPPSRRNTDEEKKISSGTVTPETNEGTSKKQQEVGHLLQLPILFSRPFFLPSAPIPIKTSSSFPVYFTKNRCNSEF